MRRRLATISAAVVAMAALPAFGQTEQGSKNRLDEFMARQTAARQQFSQDLAGVKSAEERKPIVARYLVETTKNTGDALALVRANLRDPLVAQALKFVITSAKAGPGDESYQALKLLRDHVCDPGMGELCGHIFFFVHEPAADNAVTSPVLGAPVELQVWIADSEGRATGVFRPHRPLRRIDLAGLLVQLPALNRRDFLIRCAVGVGAAL